MQDLRDLLHRVSSARVLSDRAPPASLSCGGDAFGSDGSCRDADYDMLTFKKRLQRHTRLLPFQVDRPGAMQVCSSTLFAPPRHLQLSREGRSDSRLLLIACEDLGCPSSAKENARATCCVAVTSGSCIRGSSVSRKYQLL